MTQERTTTDITIQLSHDRAYRVLFLAIYSIIACLQTPFLDFQSDRINFTQATFEISFSTKLCSGFRRNVEEVRQDIAQSITSHPRESQFFLSPHAETRYI